MVDSARFWDKIADKYARQPVRDEASYQFKLKKTQEYLRPDLQVLEFGCGTGSTAIVHSPFVNQILAVDCSQNMIDIARDKAAKSNVDNITFQVDTIEALQAPAESFDVVMGQSILHLVEDKDAVIKKVFELVKPGGIFVSSTACIGSGMGFLRYVVPIFRMLGKAPYVAVFTRDELISAIRRAGFDIEFQWQPEGKMAVPFIIARKP
ncbi:MAG: class I SAM-dependent methyltransferase [Gammaproteobacteria bacterium]|nr:class I SAM-dependent methyltransferase [Gammaproteobacteria bacterium]